MQWPQAEVVSGLARLPTAKKVYGAAYYRASVLPLNDNAKSMTVRNFLLRRAVDERTLRSSPQENSCDYRGVIYALIYHSVIFFAKKAAQTSIDVLFYNLSCLKRMSYNPSFDMKREKGTVHPTLSYLSRQTRTKIKESFFRAYS